MRRIILSTGAIIVFGLILTHFIEQHLKANGVAQFTLKESGCAYTVSTNGYVRAIDTSCKPEVK